MHEEQRRALDYLSRKGTNAPAETLRAQLRAAFDQIERRFGQLHREDGLVHLVERLKARGFELLDTQFTTEHLKSFGAIDVPKAEYEVMLADAMSSPDLAF